VVFIAGRLVDAGIAPWFGGGYRPGQRQPAIALRLVTTGSPTIG
jgi:hypothetical protein